MKKMKTEGTYIFGRNAVLEALASGAPLEKIFVAYGSQGEAVNKVFAKAKKEHIACSLIDKKKFAELEHSQFTPGVKTQGIIALLRSFETLSIEQLIKKSYEKSEQPLIVALDGITDPHNLGAIARSAECVGAGGLILPEHNSAPITPVAIKASAGALEHIPVAKVVNLIQALEKLKDKGFWIVGTDEDADTLYTANIYDRPLIIIIGSEGSGMRQSTGKHCDYLIKIPLMGKVTSLNASVSSGIILFEALRQRGFGI